MSIITDLFIVFDYILEKTESGTCIAITMVPQSIQRVPKGG